MVKSAMEDVGREFGINLITWQRASLAARVGGTSGQTVDKFQEFDIQKEKLLRTEVPVLKDDYAAYECKLVGSNALRRPYLGG